MVQSLRGRDVEYLTAYEDRLNRAEDEHLLARATALGRVFVSQDKDLLAITSAWLSGGHAFAGLIYSHQLNILVGQFVTDVEMVVKIYEASELRNLVVFLPV